MSGTKIRSKDGERLFDVTVAFESPSAPLGKPWAVFLTLEDGSPGSVWLSDEEFRELVFVEE